MTRKFIQTVAGPIIVQFLIAGCFLALLQSRQFSDTIYGPGSILLALLLTVLTTVFLGYGKEQDRTAGLQKDLDACKHEHREMQSQFEQSIEAKIYELQMTNGALNREIAERIQAEEESRELQKQQALILDSAGEGILGLDYRGRVTFVNRAALLMLGWDEDELVGARHHARIHHSRKDGSVHPEEDCPIYKAYKDGKVHYRSGDVFWCKNGSNFEVEYVSTPIRDHGMLRGAVVVFRDSNTYK